MNCREFTAEFEERRSALSQSAQLHLNDCPDCKTMSGKQTRVWQMIDGLKRVEAPNDFDFRVRAKIAGAKPADFQAPRFLPALRYALPLAVIVLLLGLIAFNVNYFSGGNASQVGITVLSTAVEKEITANDPFVSNQNILPVAESQRSDVNQSNANTILVKNTQQTQIAVVNTRKKPRTEAPEKKAEEIDGGSRDSTVSAPPITLALGLEPNRKIEPAPNTDAAKSFTAEEILPFLGIEGVLQNGKWQVKAVRQNSLAEHSGVQVGDVIEAIDGIKISAEPLRAKRIEGKNLTVVRSAKKIEITLKN